MVATPTFFIFTLKNWGKINEPILTFADFSKGVGSTTNEKWSEYWWSPELWEELEHWGIPMLWHYTLVLLPVLPVHWDQFFFQMVFFWWYAKRCPQICGCQDGLNINFLVMLVFFPHQFYFGDVLTERPFTACFFLEDASSMVKDTSTEAGYESGPCWYRWCFWNPRFASWDTWKQWPKTRYFPYELG